jgi:hypothetical protein
MFNEEKTLMQNIMNLEVQEFIKTNVKESMESSSDEDFKDGNVLYKTLIKRTGIQTLIKDYLKTNDSNNNCESVSELFGNVTQQIINDKGSYTWKEAIKQIEKYRAQLGKHFYGAVLRSTKKSSVIINPYHPLTALSLMSEADAEVNSYTYNIIIYVYNDRDRMDDYYKTEASDKKKVQENINGIITTYLNRINTIIKVEEAASRLDASGNLKIKFRTRKHNDEEESNDYLVVAHQLLTNGILAPWYGTSLLRKPIGRNGTTGLQLGPIRSCNISGARANNRSGSYNNVCTGRLSSNTLKGLRSLTHANLGSPFTREIVAPGGLAYIDAMIDKSVELYKAGEIL